MLSVEALTALVELDAGARFNCIHTVSRELIAAGYAFDGWGYLEITERGRRKAREKPHRHFAIDDPNISNMGDRNEPMAALDELPQVTIEQGLARRTGLPEPDAAEAVDRNKPTLAAAMPADVFDKKDLVARDFPSRTMLVWSRQRAIAAAGVANGKVGVWVDEKWVTAFLEAYEHE